MPDTKRVVVSPGILAWMFFGFLLSIGTTVYTQGRQDDRDRRSEERHREVLEAIRAGSLGPGGRK